jgi:glutathione S-transferase
MRVQSDATRTTQSAVSARDKQVGCVGNVVAQTEQGQSTLDHPAPVALVLAAVDEPRVAEPKPCHELIGATMSLMLAKVYVITGSHACRTATLMLEHKGIPYRRVELPTGLHPLLIRACGFAGNHPPIRTVDGATNHQLALLDRLGTVPALRLGAERIQTNREIARFLEHVQPEPALFPREPESRQDAEDAERWGDEILQMAARRVALATDLEDMNMRGADGRLGPLLARSGWMRALLSRTAGQPFRANSRNVDALLGAIPPMLDKVDAWIGEGVLCADELNVADFTIAPSLALLAYHRELREQISARPAGVLVDRLLPEPHTL